MNRNLIIACSTDPDTDILTIEERNGYTALKFENQYTEKDGITTDTFHGSIHLNDPKRKQLLDFLQQIESAVPMLLWCPQCGERHIDVGDFATKLHHTHACQECGHVWRPAIVATCGVKFLPGFKNA